MNKEKQQYQETKEKLEEAIQGIQKKLAECSDPKEIRIYAESISRLTDSLWCLERCN